MSRNVAKSVIPQYYTTLKLDMNPVVAKLNVCYQIDSTSLVDTGLEMNVLKIASFEVSSVPEGVTIAKIPLVGSGMAVGDKIRLVPDQSTCANLAVLESAIIYTDKYVVEAIEFPVIGSCMNAKFELYYVPAATDVAIPVGEFVTVNHVSLSARPDSAYNCSARSI